MIRGRILRLYTGTGSQEMVYTNIQEQKSAQLNVVQYSISGAGSDRGIKNYKTMLGWLVSGNIYLTDAMFRTFVLAIKDRTKLNIQFGDTGGTLYRGKVLVQSAIVSSKGNNLVVLNVNLQGTGALVMV